MGKFVEDQLTSLQTLSTEYLRVITALLLRDGVLRYELDTGQGRQSVTAADLPELQETYTKLLVQIDQLEDRVNGSGGFIGRPAW